MRLPDDQLIHSIGLLALVLDGTGDSFTGQLLLLIAKADPGNREALRRGFPDAVSAYETWQSFRDAPTAAQLEAALDAATGDASSAAG